MTICVTCGDYFRTNAWHNDKQICQNCVDIVPAALDEDYELEKKHLLNPSGKTPAVFYDNESTSWDEREDSFGF